MTNTLQNLQLAVWVLNMPRFAAQWIAIFVLGFMHHACIAQAADAQNLKTVYSGHAHDFIFSISLDGKDGVAVGDHGLILSSSDGGHSWTKVENSATKSALFSVVRKSGKCLASGQSGEIIRSDDCKKWEVIKPIMDARLLSVNMNSKGQAVAVGAFGAIQKSDDWGKTWSALTPPWQAVLKQDAEPHLYSANVSDDGNITVAGEFELVLRSADGGKNWKTLHKGARSIFSLALRGNGIYAVGQEGLILKSSDNGGSWSQIKSGTNALLNDLFVSKDANTFVIAGMRAVLISKDGGKTITSNNSPKVKSGIFSTVVGDSVGGKLNIFIGGSAAEIIEVVN